MVTNSLRENLLAHFTNSGQAENPLRVIGLTKEILELGLNDEELHAFCLGRARHLLSIFHEDTKMKTPRTAELQVKYSNAFSALKKRADFVNFLREFSGEYTEERREEVILRKALESERAISQNLRIENAKLTTKSGSGVSIQQNFGAYLRGIASNFSLRPTTNKWDDLASLNAEGEIAVMKVQGKSRKRQPDIPDDLIQKFQNGYRILQNLGVIDLTNTAILQIYKISGGKIHLRRSEFKRILGCVDHNATDLTRTQNSFGRIGSPLFFNETSLLTHIKPLFFAPSFLVVSSIDEHYSIFSHNTKEVVEEITYKTTRPFDVNMKKQKIHGIQFPTRYLFLGFKANQAGV